MMALHFTTPCRPTTAAQRQQFGCRWSEEEDSARMQGRAIVGEGSDGQGASASGLHATRTGIVDSRKQEAHTRRLPEQGHACRDGSRAGVASLAAGGQAERRRRVSRQRTLTRGGPITVCICDGRHGCMQVYA